MRRYFLRRIAQIVFVLWALITIMFFLFRLVPGDPVAVMISAELTEGAREALREGWGLNRPLGEQYFLYIKNLLVGDFGMSFYHQEPVWDVLGEKVVNTLALMIPATVIGIILGVLGGMYLGWWRGSALERIGVVLPPLIRAMPVFWLGVLLLMVFSYKFALFPNA
jgi:peptide/nickel transport system permease protein